MLPKQRLPKQHRPLKPAGSYPATDRDAKSLAKTLVRLHQTAKQSALLRQAPPYQSSLLKIYAGLIQRARSHGHVATIAGGRGLRAAFLVARGCDDGNRQPQITAAINYMRKDTTVTAWLRRQCRDHRDVLSHPRTALLLPTHQRWLLPHLLSQGCHIESVILAGNVVESRRGLGVHYQSRLAWPRHTGLDVAELHSRSQVDQVVTLIRREFRRNPQYCWFAAKQKYLLQLRRELLRARLRPPGLATHFVILDGRRVVGYFGFQTPRQHPWVGRHAAVTMTFAQEIQGQGYAKFAYMHLLRRMEKMRLKLFIGATAQPPVMKLSAALGRQVVGYYLRGGPGHFSSAHFKRSNILSFPT